MAAEVTPEMLAVIERQRAYFASDECLLDRAAIWRDATPEECWAATADAFDEAHALLALQPPAVRERVLEPDRVPDALLAALARRSHP